MSESLPDEMEELWHAMLKINGMNRALISNARKIGQREMKPLIRELLEALEETANWRAIDKKRLDPLTARAKEALDND